MIDIGTGDGVYVYQSALHHPRKFYIGVDASPRPLEKVSEKIHRKPSKGGLPNALFVQAAVEDLPAELDGVADAVHVHFPWGSLLRAAAAGERLVLQNLRRACSTGASLEVVLGIDPERDRTEMARLGLEPMSAAYIDSTLAPQYRDAGFEVMERRVLSDADWSQIHTSWAKRLRGSDSRSVFRIVARAAALPADFPSSSM
ncbi:MAG TPA: class I SAM-dependent methyltransferase [Thermoanaerobaculia bacterium]|nr:class I SAM-dependent methyltransferase [Thermoanaerobaculia bacterium]